MTLDLSMIPGYDTKTKATKANIHKWIYSNFGTPKETISRVKRHPLGETYLQIMCPIKVYYPEYVKNYNAITTTKTQISMGKGLE